MPAKYWIGLIIALVFIISLAFLPGCEDEDKNPIKKPIVIQDFVYPLDIGNHWEYTGKSYKFNIVPESLIQKFSDTISISSIVEITSLDTLMDTWEVYCIHETSILNDTAAFVDTFNTDVFVNNTPAGLFAYAYSGTNDMITPKIINPKLFYIFKGRRYDSIKEIINEVNAGFIQISHAKKPYEEYWLPPILSLKYPLMTGSQWQIRDSGYTFPIYKTITDWKEVSSPAGNFGCFEIKLNWDVDEDGTFDTDIVRYDYISESGLISRKTIARGIILSDNTGANLGTADFYVEFILTGVDLVE